MSAHLASRPALFHGLALLCVSVFLLQPRPAAAMPPPKPRPTDPVLSLPLDELGFPGVRPQLLMGSATMFTVHFVDATHLLFTYNSRTLMPRLPDADAEDDDRNVAVLLLELPSGNVLARTELRTRDHEQYLWPLGHGRFLFRSRYRLTVMDPLRMLPTGDAFRQQPFVDLKRRIGYISVSPDGDLVTVETIPKRKPETRLIGAAASAAALAATVPGYNPPPPAPPEPEPEDDLLERRVPVQIHFYRIATDVRSGKPDRLIVQSAGLVYSPALLNLPVTAEGFLTALKESSHSWDFDFHAHTGKQTELAVFDSSCAPHPYFITRSDFVAIGCRGDINNQELGGFNLRGEHSWISIFSGRHVSPSLIPAPEAGRFALSRTLISTQLVDPDNLTPELITAQEVSVLQAHDGRVLLKVQTSPVQRAGQNFDLSPDGMQLVTIHAGNLELYRLPALTFKDLAELKRSVEAYPERNDVSIVLGSTPVATRKDARAEGIPLGSEVLQPSAPEPPPAGAVAPAKSNVPVADATIVGDPQGDPPRKPPTLYDPDHPKPATPQ